MYKKALYNMAYRMLNNSTPLKADCGLICNSKCCNGDEGYGMLLFPGEKEYLTYKRSELIIKDKSLYGMNVPFAVCKGLCNRNLRPLSCRIYPLAPYINSGKLTIIEDPRAKYICPLLFEKEILKIDVFFKRNVYDTFYLMSQDAEIKHFLINFSKLLDEYARFTG